MRHKCHAKAVNQFCSRECHGAWNSKNKALENHPRWLGGEGTEVLRTCNGVLRRWVKVGDGRFVQNYRVVLEKAGVCVPRGHVVHHRDGNQLNDALGNLEVLTRKEHLERHPEIMEAAWEMSRGK
jgi:Ni,Fe-hydrogenase I large subunit